MQRRRFDNPYVRTFRGARNERIAGRVRAAQSHRQEAFGVRRAARMATSYNRRMRARNVVTAGFLGVEKKFYDTALPKTNVVAGTACAGGELDPTLNSAGASTPNCLSCPAQGDGPENRDGKRIVAKYISVKGSVSRARVETQTDPDSESTVFVALVLDTQSNGAQMNSEDCFKNITGENAGTINPERNLLFGSRFKVLKSEIFVMDARTLTVVGANEFSINGQTVCFDWFVPLNNMIINFNAGTTSDVANVIDNSLHIIAFQQTGATVVSQLTYNARLRFMG